MSKTNPPLLAATLYGKWINDGEDGRDEVLREISAMSGMRAACVAAFMTVLLIEKHDAESFIGAMQKRLP